jgi:hypothetical protein
MRSSFFGYYPPTTGEYERLWNEGLIVLDTNVLLDLYRLPTVARDELFVVLESLKERLWIPHQVALEFHRKRLAVIAAERKTMEDALTSASDLVTAVEEKVNALQIEKRGIGIEPDALISDLNRANSQLVEAIKKAHSSQLDISASDPVRERLDELLNGRVGTGPSNQAELDALCADGENRYRENIPPGFKDADKDKNPKEATFMFDHIKYQRKYGDLILWRQLIRHVKDAGIKTVVLVTADRKEDWWWREQGKTIGPHPELVREIRREGQVELFWMYSSVQFVEHANKYSSAQVSVESVAEIQNVTSTETLIPTTRHEKLIENSELLRFDYSENIRRYPYGTRQLDLRFNELSVGNWLQSLGYDATYNENDFPDILIRKSQGIHGYEVKSTKNLRKFLFSASAINALMQGYIEKNERRLNAFSLVIVIPEEHFEEEMEREEDDRLIARCNLLLREYSADEIIVGSLIQESFELLCKFINPVS